MFVVRLHMTLIVTLVHAGIVYLSANTTVGILTVMLL